MIGITACPRIRWIEFRVQLKRTTTIKHMSYKVLLDFFNKRHSLVGVNYTQGTLTRQDDSSVYKTYHSVQIGLLIATVHINIFSKEKVSN